MKLNSVQELIEDIRNGKMVILVDDEDRENEGDLVIASDHITPEVINFMIREARGLVCLSLKPEQVDRLQLPLMVKDELNFSPNKTAFTVSIEAAEGVTTGISTEDRARTVKVAASPHAKPSDVLQPGHIFPIRAQAGGVLKRAGHTEGSVDLAALAGLNPAAVICEIINDDGTMARIDDLILFGKKHGIKIGSIVDLIQYRLETETLVEEVADVSLQLRPGFQVRAFRSRLDGTEHLVLQKGEISPDEPVLVRVEAESLTRNLLSGYPFETVSPLNLAMQRIEEEGSGILLYLRDNERRQSLVNEIQAFSQVTKEQKESEIDGKALKMDSRDYGIGAQILRAIGVRKLRLLSQRAPKKIGLRAFDLEIVETVSLGKNHEEIQNERTDENTRRPESHTTKNWPGDLPLQ